MTSCNPIPVKTNEGLWPGQFVLSDDQVHGPQHWAKTQVDERLVLYTHPKVPTSQVTENGRTLTLIGFLLDPEMPKADDQAILRGLLEVGPRHDELLLVTTRLGGRWVLLLTGPGGPVLVHDPLGSRQVHYVEPRFAEHTGVRCGSEPQLLRALTGAEVDSAASWFSGSASFTEMRGGHWWPADASPLAGVRRLLPNHWLDLRTQDAHRWWPAGRLAQLDLERASARIAAILRGTLAAAHHRGDLALLLTGGGDSRLVLAAGRPYASELDCVTIRYPQSYEADVETARALAERFGLTHVVVESGTEPSANFWERYRNNVMLPHPGTAANAEALSTALRPTVTTMTGHGAEVGTCRYRGSRFAPKMTAQRISLETGTQAHPYAVDQQRMWLGNLPDDGTVNVSDLLFWEQRCGSWMGAWTCGYDMVWGDCLLPFNQRELLTTLLGVPERDRTGPQYLLRQRTIERLWPELLTVPTQVDLKPKPSLVDRARRTAKFCLPVGRPGGG